MQLIGNLTNIPREKKAWQTGRDYWMAETVTDAQKEQAARIFQHLENGILKRFPPYNKSSNVEMNLTKEGGVSVNLPLAEVSNSETTDMGILKGAVMGAALALGQEPLLEKHSKYRDDDGQSLPFYTIEFDSLDDLEVVAAALAEGRKSAVSRLVG